MMDFLQYLNEDDLKQLVPEIGLRSILRGSILKLMKPEPEEAEFQLDSENISTQANTLAESSAGSTPGFSGSAANSSAGSVANSSAKSTAGSAAGSTAQAGSSANKENAKNLNKQLVLFLL